MVTRLGEHDKDQPGGAETRFIATARSEVVEILAGAVLGLLLEGRRPKAEGPKEPVTEGSHAG